MLRCNIGPVLALTDSSAAVHRGRAILARGVNNPCPARPFSNEKMDGYHQPDVRLPWRSGLDAERQLGPSLALAV